MPVSTSRRREPRLEAHDCCPVHCLSPNACTRARGCRCGRCPCSCRFAPLPRLPSPGPSASLLFFTFQILFLSFPSSHIDLAQWDEARRCALALAVCRRAPGRSARLHYAIHESAAAVLSARMWVGARVGGGVLNALPALANREGLGERWLCLQALALASAGVKRAGQCTGACSAWPSSARSVVCRGNTRARSDGQRLCSQTPGFQRAAHSELPRRRACGPCWSNDRGVLFFNPAFTWLGLWCTA